MIPVVELDETIPLIEGGAARFVENADDDADEVELSADIVKLDDAKHLVFGWFSVVKVGQRLLKDTQDDIIAPDTLEASAYDFVLTARKGGEMHDKDGGGEVRGVGTLVESVVFTKEKQAAMVESLKKQGIDAVIDLGCVAWWGGFHVHDDSTWEKVTTGELRGWSIGGRGKRASV